MRNLIVLIIAFLAITYGAGYLAATLFGLLAGVVAAILAACLMLLGLWEALGHVEIGLGYMHHDNAT